MTTQCPNVTFIGSVYVSSCGMCDTHSCGDFLPASSCSSYGPMNQTAVCKSTPAGRTDISIAVSSDDRCAFGGTMYKDITQNECVQVGATPAQILSCYNGQVTYFVDNMGGSTCQTTPTGTVKSGSCFFHQGFYWKITCPSALVPGVSSSSTGPGSPSSATPLSTASVALSLALLLLVVVMV
jgi:hypothetical protein